MTKRDIRNALGYAATIALATIMALLAFAALYFALWIAADAGCPM